MKKWKRLVVVVLAMCMLLGTCTTVWAEEDLSATPQSGVMKMAWSYVTDANEIFDIGYSTCFLINESYVLTNYHSISFITEEDRSAVIKAINKRYGLDLKELNNNDSHLKIFILPNRDTRVEGTIHPNASSDVSHLDFAAIQLSSTINGRTPMQLGDSDSVEARDTVYAYGFPEDSLENKEENTISDVSVVNGAVSKMTEMPYADIIEHSAQLNNGNSGGPLTDENNNVIGINEFILEKKNYSIQINQIKSILDTYGIAYTSAGAPAASAEEGKGEAKDTAADVEFLQSKITEAQNLDTAKSSDASVAALNEAITAAKAVAENTNASADEVNAAVTSLDTAIKAASQTEEAVDVTALTSKLKEAEAMDTSSYTKDSVAALEAAIADAQGVEAEALSAEAVSSAISDLDAAMLSMEEKSFDAKWIIIIVAIVIVVAIIICIILMMRKPKVVSGGARPVPTGGTGGTGSMGTSAMGTGTLPSSTPRRGEAGSEGTVMLGSGSDETTFLAGTHGSAYLLRRKNMDKVMINSARFVIGRERNRVDYCILDNGAVGRVHAVISKKGDNYYFMDNDSKNFSYLNGKRAAANVELLLSDKAIIKLADEEFEFHKA